jgi:hypothetical protein
MWHRFQLKSSDGFDFGYQWQDCDLEHFTNVATGNPVVGDAEAQSRDSTHAQCHEPQYRTVNYVAVWDHDVNAWTDDVADPATAYTAWAQEGPGG